jgi:hypothetical protein
MNWSTANKVAVIFGIIGGVYLLFQLYQLFFSARSSFESEILIREINSPITLQQYSFRDAINGLLPTNYDRYELTEEISDSLSFYLNVPTYKSRRIIHDLIPKEPDYIQLKSDIDSLITNLIHPLKANYFVQTNIKNIGDKIAQSVRFEIPSHGYFELIQNGEITKNGNFRNSIEIGDLRIQNNAQINIWSFGHVSNYHVKTSKEIRYTFNEGVIYPKTTELVISEGLLFWMYKNPFLLLYLIGAIIWIFFSTKFQMKKVKENP